VTVYLVPGLTVGERRAVLRRLRQEASRGFGPPLPVLALALALCADKVRTTAVTGASLIRLHPAVTLLPSVFLAAVMTLFVLASAGGTVDFTHVSQVSGLALSPDAGNSQPGGALAAPVRDRELFAVVNLGPAEGGGSGQSLSLGNLTQGKHAHGGGPRWMAMPPVKCTPHCPPAAQPASGPPTSPGTPATAQRPGPRDLAR
jgi:hypothetical protein